MNRPTPDMAVLPSGPFTPEDIRQVLKWKIGGTFTADFVSRLPGTVTPKDIANLLDTWETMPIVMDVTIDELQPYLHDTKYEKEVVI